MLRKRALESRLVAIGFVAIVWVCMSAAGCSKNSDVTGVQQGGGGRVAAAPDLATPKATRRIYSKLSTPSARSFGACSVRTSPMACTGATFRSAGVPAV